MKEVKGRRARLKLKCFESLDHQHSWTLSLGTETHRQLLHHYANYDLTISWNECQFL
jgi:hypothetical protein